ncbi:MAG: hypothetical protein JWN38_587 [Candidatus Saccharibacteria bacterium]|nr:hypothetical protein [Candidatus Saccharibacteria bacterium]
MSALKIDLDQLLQKEISRKEFLRLAGVGVLGLTGVTGLLQNLQKFNTGSSQGPHKQIHSTNRSYGASAYGGK